MPGRSSDLVGMPFVPGRARGVVRRGPAATPTDSVLLMHEAELATLASRPAGLVVVDGAPLSHRMIGLMGLGVPTVIVDAEQAAALTEGVVVTLDGSSGRIEAARPQSEDTVASPWEAETVTDPSCKMIDGTPVHLLASVRHGEAAALARRYGAEGIGLVRSEFIAANSRRPPDAAVYRQAFGALCDASAPLPVTIRLLDLAGDKLPAWMPALPGTAGALGLQGTRLFGFEPVKGVVLAQLEALEALSDRHALRLLIPYLVRHEELCLWAERLRERLSRALPIGAMAETPAAALDLGRWFDTADFAALGCNDLMQCFFGADRDLPELRNYLDPWAPPFYRLLRQIASGAGANLPRVQLCGVLPQLPGVLPILLGLGFRVFSVDPPLLPHLRRTVQQTSMGAAETLAAEVSEARETREVLERLGLPARRPPFLVP